eukprot:Nk52_evm13s349 gene=Nk52_evmTU13s349
MKTNGSSQAAHEEVEGGVIRIAIASTNPVKVNCVKVGFEKCFPGVELECMGVGVDSGVSDQPMGDLETYKGAFMRVENCEKACEGNHGIDYFVGIEGGCSFESVTGKEEPKEMFVSAWIVVKKKGCEGFIGKAKTASFIVPPPIGKMVNEGMELSVADKHFFNRELSKTKNGTIGQLTRDLITRQAYYEPAVVLALMPFLPENFDSFVNRGAE